MNAPTLRRPLTFREALDKNTRLTVRKSPMFGDWVVEGPRVPVGGVGFPTWRQAVDFALGAHR